MPDGDERLSKSVTMYMRPGPHTPRVGTTIEYGSSKQDLFETARKAFAFGRSIDRYPGDEELIEKARQCASTILADECPVYIAGVRLDNGENRIIHRNIPVNFPGRYELVFEK